MDRSFSNPLPAVAGGFARFGWLPLLIPAFVLAFARRPESLTAAEWAWEEGQAFYAPIFFLSPYDLALEPWASYLVLGIRLGFLATGLVPAYWAPFFSHLVALSCLVALAAYVASGRMSIVLPDRRVRLILAAFVICIPAQRDVMGLLISIQWYGGVWLALVSMATIPKTTLGRWAERALVAIAAITGPFAIVLAPAYWWRLYREPSRHYGWLAAIVTAGAILQAVVLISSDRITAADARSLEAVIVTFLLHSTLIPILGERLTTSLADSHVPLELLAAGGATLTISIVWVVLRSLSPRVLPFAFAAIAIAGSGIVIHGGSGLWPPGAYERYFLLCAVLVAAAVLSGVARGNLLAYALLPIVLIGVAADFRLDPYPQLGWETTHSCIGQPEPCIIPVWPPGYDIRWPGTQAEYVMPRHEDP